MRILQNFPMVAKLALSITLLVLSIISIASLIGLFPDKETFQIEARAHVAEALTIQLAVAASKDRFDIVEGTISAVQRRESHVRSIALRGSSGSLLASTPGHDGFWADANPDKSTKTHIRVAIDSDDTHWGTLEVVFDPVGSSFSLFGIPFSFLLFSVFTGGFCLVAIYFLLQLSLRQLNPGRLVPSRVQSAFDSLSDGIAVVDEKDEILLINRSLADIICDYENDNLGKKLSDLLWRYRKNEGQTSEFPWLTALRENRTIRDVAMNLRSGSGAIVNVLVNASPISTSANSVNGALVTFKDVTVIERKNQDLSLAYAKLQRSESEIAKQNSQLKYLASHDPLTSCLNRRSFFEEFQGKYEASATTGQPLMCLMIDIDHFKSVNDTYGHAVGDSVIKGLAQLLRQTCRKGDIVGRYGGEEFCMLLDGADESSAAEVAEYLRQEAKAQSGVWLGNDRSLSISIGIAPADLDAGSINNAVDHADQALYAAKESGRDRAIQWHPDSFANVAKDEVVQTMKLQGAEQDSSRVRASIELSTPSETFVEKLEISVGQSKQDQKSVGVICVSVDSLEEQISGDDPETDSTAISTVDKRLTSIIQESEFISLMPGNEPASLVKFDGSRFLIAITQIDDPVCVSWIMQRLADKLPMPANAASQVGPIRFSLGASLYPKDGLNSEELIECAVLAQKKALELGGNKAFRMFAGDMTDADQRQLLIEKGIRDAIERNEFSLYFQPIVDLITGEVACAEVLLRSSNTSLKGTSIDVVIQVAEKTGLIHELSSYVFKTTFSIINGWKNSGIQLPLISINLSAEQLKSEDVVIDLLGLVEAYQIDPSAIQFEMTETAMVTDIERTADILRTLQNYGFHIALDDFGTGQSTLSHLLKINPDTIKIDRSFIQSLTSNRTNQLLVSTISDLSRKIGAKVVAEGVETQEQLTMLMEIGCPYVQGYWLSRPLPAQVFEDWLLLFSAGDPEMKNRGNSSAVKSGSCEDDLEYSLLDKRN